jgi:hypothetical protein
MARKQTINPDPEDLRKDLLAALAAGRELGPEMDTAIVEAHLRRHYGPEAIQPANPKPKPAAVVERAPMRRNVMIPPMMLLLGIVAFAAVAIATGGHLLWLLWPLMFLGWTWGGGYRRWYRRQRGGSWSGGPYDARSQNVAPGAQRAIPPEII